MTENLNIDDHIKPMIIKALNSEKGRYRMSAADSINIKCPEHLHTLQNLIYFLSGEEMPVNIPNN